MSNNIKSKFALPGGQSPLVVGAWMAGGILAAALMTLLVPAELIAAAGGGSSGGSSATQAFNKKGTAGLKDIGVPVFGATAMAGIVMGIFAKKFALAAGTVLVAAIGLAISLDPEGTMKSLGGGIADLFKS